MSTINNLLFSSQLELIPCARLPSEDAVLLKAVRWRSLIEQWKDMQVYSEMQTNSLFEYQEGDQKKKEIWSFTHEIYTRFSYLLQVTAPNSFGTDEFSMETTVSLLQKDKDNHVHKHGTSSWEPSRMQDLKQEESKDEPDASSSELKRTARQ